MTPSECISSISRCASANRNVIDNIAFSIVTTNTRAWGYAFVANASLVLATIAVDDTFRATSRVWVTKVFRKASAWASSASFLANGISTARWRIAGIDFFYTDRFNNLRDEGTTREWISSVARQAGTLRIVVENTTFRIETTGRYTRISTFLLDTSQMLRTVRWKIKNHI